MPDIVKEGWRALYPSFLQGVTLIILLFIKAATKSLKSLSIFNQDGAQINRQTRSGVQNKHSFLGLGNVTRWGAGGYSS